MSYSIAMILAGAVVGAPDPTSWVAPGPDPIAVSGAAVSGVSAIADTNTDTVQVRDAWEGLVRSVTRAQIQAALPWMTLDSTRDGPCGVAMSDSGRLCFIAVTDTNPPPDALPTDAILRLDVDTGQLTVFARVDMGGPDASRPKAAMAHFKGRLYVGLTGSVATYRAQMNDLVGTLLASSTLAAGQHTQGVAIDRGMGLVLAATASQVSAALVQPTPGLAWVALGPRPNIRALAFSDHYGGPSNAGLYVLSSTASASDVWFVPLAQSRFTQAYSPTLYTSTTPARLDIAMTAEGGLIWVGTSPSAAQRVFDSTDTRLSFNTFLLDEFDQHVAFATGLIAPDGEPPGWVIDADVLPGATRFHPASPDAACWATLALVMGNEVRIANGGPGLAGARGEVRTILKRYAGQMPDGISPTRSADGIYIHWINPATGGPTWGTEYATMSTMKIVLAASRARRYFAGDPEIRAAAGAIICGVSNWDSYFHPATRQMYLVANAGGGPNTSSASGPYHEGMLFAEEARRYGGTNSQAAYTKWFDRAQSPVASVLTGRFVNSDAPGRFLPSFTNLYSLLTHAEYRASASWQDHTRTMRASQAAWTDDNGPRHNTVFSAGTTRSDWGGYHADSLTDHPGDVTTFTSLLGYAAGLGDSAPGVVNGRVPEAVGAYHAYRTGARQAFKSGASILYRLSNVDPAYRPDSAGLPDVTIGALGLAELLAPHSVQRVLVGPHPACPLSACMADMDDGSGQGAPDNAVDISDLLYFLTQFDAGAPSADFDDGSATNTPDDAVDISDLLYYLARFDAGC